MGSGGPLRHPPRSADPPIRPQPGSPDCFRQVRGGFWF